jgi:hypothetical protein
MACVAGMSDEVACRVAVRACVPAHRALIICTKIMTLRFWISVVMALPSRRELQAESLMFMLQLKTSFSRTTATITAAAAAAIAASAAAVAASAARARKCTSSF